MKTKGENMDSIKDKTEQAIIPIRAEVRWWIALGFLAILGVCIAYIGMKTSYKVGYRDGVIAEKIGILEDHDIAREEIERGQAR